jgi:hypothetical protein
MDHIDRYCVAAASNLSGVVCAYVDVVVSEHFVDVGEHSGNVSVMNEEGVDGFFLKLDTFARVNCAGEVSSEKVLGDDPRYFRGGFPLRFDG